LQHLRRAFQEHAQSFDHVATFLSDVDWLVEREGTLHLTPKGRDAAKLITDDGKIRERLLGALGERSSPYRAKVASYICNYDFDGKEMKYRPSVEDRLESSWIRDLLIDLRVVSYRRSDDTYVLSQGANDLYVWAKTTRQAMSKSQHDVEVAKRDALGRSAEVAVMQYERSRLGEAWWPFIEHVSMDAPFACYDIKSLSIQDGKPIPRYIEVKAVSRDTFQFYWSKPEIEVAQVMRERYYLYLVPVAGEGLLLQELSIVPDPYSAIYSNPQEWNTEENVVICTRR
jgi:hypothetical protein